MISDNTEELDDVKNLILTLYIWEFWYKTF